MIRSFVAIELNAAIRKGMARTIKALEQEGAAVKWARADQAHLTLVFLGDLSDSQIVPASKALDRVAAGVEPFNLSVAGLGTFARRSHPSVIWAGVAENSPNLSHLHDRISAATEELSIPQERRQFSPHLTLGRVKSQKGIEPMMAQIKRQAEAPLGSMTVTSMRLLMSTLTPKGPEYTVMSTHTLGGGTHKNKEE